MLLAPEHQKTCSEQSWLIDVTVRKSAQWGGPWNTSVGVSGRNDRTWAFVRWFWRWLQEGSFSLDWMLWGSRVVPWFGILVIPLQRTEGMGEAQAGIDWAKFAFCVCVCVWFGECSCFCLGSGLTMEQWYVCPALTWSQSGPIRWFFVKQFMFSRRTSRRSSWC